MNVNIKIDTVKKEILILGKVQLDDLSVFLSGLKELIDLSDFSISCEKEIIKEYITINDNGILDKFKKHEPYNPYNPYNPYIVTY